ncbi:MAG: sigma-54 dependent transcriptional regulator [Chloracidobacterium sp.]|uniref:Sigma-54-dependent Fis family transcriptional regulator n=1 Tax=Chloracidobacterium validum TaxID=2821543 RepID=A0ABX8BDI1_9BACT|nr:sigma-54 dependent transcriptional regulator [Chloracidobacterium validum]QUW03703.1 sigma-54-dependent Fis family transcriptional regulator [Chloracidobacterium validum]
MPRKGSLLVVDDEEIMRDVLETLLSGAGYSVKLAQTGEEGLELYREQVFDVVLLDVSMPGMGGIATLDALLEQDPDAIVVMITAYATFETAVSAWQRGAFNCIRKPFENEDILRVVEAGIRRRRKDEEHAQLKRVLQQSADKHGIVARSAVMQDILALVEQVAPARTTVLIQGESGTGKELIARAVHFASPRAKHGQFVAVNCGNIPTELLESELFGHVRGAFTGAFAAKKGLFEIADGGTLFLDEIGNISFETQSKLLRVIQEREFIPLGDTSPRRVDARIVAATNLDLKQAVLDGKFREDLFYRLNVITIKLPPLRERPQDILPLTRHFIRKYNAENQRQMSEDIDPEVLALLEAYPFPGNVRELENIIERAVVISRTDRLTMECLRDEILNPTAKSTPSAFSGNLLSSQLDISQGIRFYDVVAQFEIELIQRALDFTHNHQSRAAKLLNLNPTTLNSKIKNYNIK